MAEHIPTGDVAVEPPAPMRCRGCFYILENLHARVCPECGKPFDPSDPTTFTRKPPYVPWLFWLPLVLSIGIGGGLVWFALILAVGFGVATTVVTPVCLGLTLGYCVPFNGVSKLIRYGLAAVAVLGLAVGVLSGSGLAEGVVGGFCGAILFLVALVPVLFGTLMGFWLVRYLHRSRFSQREYLHGRVWLIVLLPAIFAAIEGRHPAGGMVTVTTSQVINAPPHQTWNGIQFFEQVQRPTPWLLRLSPSLRPLYTVGHSEKIGDLRTCFYARGKLVKRITELVPDRRLAFSVVTQDRIENDSAILRTGSFDLTPIDSGHTRVSLTTTYQPLLEPRPVYGWAEAWAIHTLHGHVLAGMKDKAETP